MMLLVDLGLISPRLVSKWRPAPQIPLSGIHSLCEAFSARTFLVALLHCSPFTPRSLRIRCNEWPAKRRHPASPGSQRALQSLLQHSVTRSAYLAVLRSLASSIRSSRGTVSSSRTTHFADSDVNTMSAVFSGNMSCLLRLSWSCPSRAVARSPPKELGWCCAFSSALMKVMDC